MSVCLRHTHLTTSDGDGIDIITWRDDTDPYLVEVYHGDSLITQVEFDDAGEAEATHNEAINLEEQVSTIVREEEMPTDDGSPAFHACPACGAGNGAYLGQLARLLWWRCVDCGALWSEEGA